MKIERVYHPYWLWEDYLNGMYGKPIFSRIDTGETEEERLLKVGECLGNEKVCREYMQYVIDNWKYACEYRLTNKSINRIAWLGQSAMNVYAGLKSKPITCIIFRGTLSCSSAYMPVKVKHRNNRVDIYLFIHFYHLWGILFDSQTGPYC